jgi:hypothetical protein
MLIRYNLKNLMLLYNLVLRAIFVYLNKTFAIKIVAESLKSLYTFIIFRSYNFADLVYKRVLVDCYIANKAYIPISTKARFR